MNKIYSFFAVALLLTAWLSFGPASKAQTTDLVPEAPSTTLVISQVDGGGGGSTGTYLFDYVEIKNVSANSQSLNGLSLYYGSATGNFASSGTNAFALPNTLIGPGQYYLVQVGTAGTAGAPLPVTPDAVTTNIAMSGSSGKIALVNTAGLPINTCGASATPCSATQLAQIVDWVAYGAAGNGTAGNGEGGTSVNNGVALTSTQGGVRKGAGCTDTDNNNLDFDVITAPVPRNGASTPVVCGGGGGAILFASMAANPSTVSPGGSTLLTVSVTPATTPPSTGITVVGNLSDIGGLPSQPFYDDGTHGDTIPGDNIFSFSAVVASGTSSGNHIVTAVASDLEGRTAAVQQTINVPGVVVDDPLLLGNPSNATANIANENNYLMPKPQYTLSYNRSKATANWVAWRLDSSWIGTAPRQDDFRPDPALPAAWYHVTDGDYSGSGYSRGHMCPSGDRTRTIPDNSATFLMTNMIPQISENNEGPWADLENYCRTLAQAGNELYIISGPSGNAGTIANGRIVVPTLTWKVVLVLPNGNNDLSRISRSTRAFGVIMSNQSISQSAPWRNFRTTVDAVEYLTGHNFFSAIPKNTQEIIERRRDRQ
jgi:DNA/RNA endonuclease G (NUC1)